MRAFDRVVNMPEKCWYSLTVREETSKRVKEMAKGKSLTVDEPINELMTKPLRGVWLTCSLYRSRVKDGNMTKHMARAHSETMKR